MKAAAPEAQAKRKWKRAPGYYRGVMQRLREEWGNRCRADRVGLPACGVSGTARQLEFAHKEPTGVIGRGRGRADRYHDIKKHPESFELLCHLCHKLYDKAYWERARKRLDPDPPLDPVEVEPVHQDDATPSPVPEVPF